MSSRRVGGRREARDGRAIRRADESFWQLERTILETKLHMLEEFAQQAGNT